MANKQSADTATCIWLQVVYCVIVIVFIVVVFLAVKQARTVTQKREVRAECAGVVLALTGYPEEAQQLADFYRAAADMVERDGKGAKILTTKHQLRTALERAAILRLQNAFTRVDGLMMATQGPDGALAKIIGARDGPLNHETAAEALRAIVIACETVQ